jgi:hypothetical protein
MNIYISGLPCMEIGQTRPILMFYVPEHYSRLGTVGGFAHSTGLIGETSSPMIVTHFPPRVKHGNKQKQKLMRKYEKNLKSITAWPHFFGGGPLIS